MNTGGSGGEVTVLSSAGTARGRFGVDIWDGFCVYKW